MAQARKEQQELRRYRKRMMVDKIELDFIALTHILKGKSVRFETSKSIESTVGILQPAPNHAR
jgi:hypothetical protein